MKQPKTSSSSKVLIPEGTHTARLYEIMYIGTIPTQFTNEDGTQKEQYKVRLTFEFPDETQEFDGEEKPLVLSKEVTFSLYRGTQTAVLRTIAHALLGAQLKDEEAEVFDIDELLGKACLVTIEHAEYSGNTYAKMVGFAPLPKGTIAKEQYNESVTKSVHTMTKEEIEALPEFLADKMKSSREYHVRFLAPRGEQKDDNYPDEEPVASPF